MAICEFLSFFEKCFCSLKISSLSICFTWHVHHHRHSKFSKKDIKIFANHSLSFRTQPLMSRSLPWNVYHSVASQPHHHHHHQQHPIPKTDWFYLFIPRFSTHSNFSPTSSWWHASNPFAKMCHFEVCKCAK